MTADTFQEPLLFRRMVITSFVIHIVIMVFFGVKAALFPKEAINLDSAIRVDMVALPDKAPQLPSKALPDSKPVAVTKPTEQKAEVKKAPVVLKANSKAKTLEKIKKLEREERKKNVLDSIKQEVAQEEAKTARQAKINQLLKGNAISHGTALHGLAKSEFNEYLGELHNHVQQHWNLPEWLQNDSLSATVIVYIDFRGVVLRRILEKSSGDSRFDSYALKAVDESSPFPPPPPKFVDLVKVDGIILGFPQ